MEHIRLLDFFGVFFQFRMENYQSFTSKTGGISFIIYIIICLSIAFYYITEFFDSDDSTNYIYSSSENFALNETINLIDENFTFAIKYPIIQYQNKTLENFFNVSVVYRSSDSFNENGEGRNYTVRQAVPNRNCSEKELYTEKPSHFKLENNIECFNFLKNQTVSGYFYSKYFKFFQILVRINSQYNNETLLSEVFRQNKIWVNILYPKNNVENFKKVKKIISDLYYLFNKDSIISSSIFIKKETFLEDDGIFYANPKKLVIAEYEKHDTFNLFQDISNLNKGSKSPPQIDIGKFYIRQFFTSVAREKIRIKLFSLFTKINTLFINVFIIFRIFMTAVNLKKAKKNILENVFYINTQNEANAKDANIKFKFKSNASNSVGFNGNKSANNSLKRSDDKRSFFIDNEKIKQKLFANQESIFLEFNKKQMNNEDLDYSEQRLDSEVEVQLDDLKEKYEEPFDSNGIKNATKDSYFESINIINDNKNNDFIINKKEESFQDIINKSSENDLKNKMLSNDNNNFNNVIDINKTNNSSNLISESNFTENNDNKGNVKANKLQKNPTMLSTMQEKFSTGNKLNGKINLRSIIKMFICCKFKQINKIKKIYSFAEEKFDDFVNIKNYIKKIQEMESLKRILFNEDAQTLFNFVSRPRFSIIFDENDNIINNRKNNIPKLSCLNYQENLYKKFTEINNKSSKTDLEKKLMQVFTEKLN